MGSDTLKRGVVPADTLRAAVAGTLKASSITQQASFVGLDAGQLPLRSVQHPCDAVPCTRQFGRRCSKFAAGQGGMMYAVLRLMGPFRLHRH